MANIVDTGAIRFSNEKVRVIADSFMQLYNLCKQVTTDFTSKNLSALFPNDASSVVDGSAQDGRTPITGNDVQILMSHVNTFITDMEASTNLKKNQINKISVNPLP